MHFSCIFSYGDTHKGRDDDENWMKNKFFRDLLLHFFVFCVFSINYIPLCVFVCVCLSLNNAGSSIHSQSKDKVSCVGQWDLKLLFCFVCSWNSNNNNNNVQSVYFIVFDVISTQTVYRLHTEYTHFYIIIEYTIM